QPSARSATRLSRSLASLQPDRRAASIPDRFIIILRTPVMKNPFSFLLMMLVATLSAACVNTAPETVSDSHEHGETENQVHLTDAQCHALDLKLVPAEKKPLRGQIEVSGRLHVLPQDAAVVSSL